MLKIIGNKKLINVFLNKQLFFTQTVFIKNFKIFSKYNYTLFYVLKILIRFGLVKPFRNKFQMYSFRNDNLPFNKEDDFECLESLRVYIEKVIIQMINI